MTTNDPNPPYALGYTNAEHERLIRQAARLAPSTERFFRAAGIGPGQRVLDLGSGPGDVAMLLSRLVGPAGAVVGVERDTRSIALARARVAEAGLRNVTFTQSDVAEVASDETFDAVAGRFILMFLADPAGALRSAARHLRVGGVVAFYEVSWTPTLALSAHLPLWSAIVSLIPALLKRAGANVDMGLALHQTFQDAGLPAPTMQMEIPLGRDPDFTRWMFDLLDTLRAQIRPHDPALETLGDLDTLADRLQAEVAASNTVAPFVGLVGAWSRRPESEASHSS
jgi:ubiquinone/menaquinone biosynthesis C-methylase UbiE